MFSSLKGAPYVPTVKRQLDAILAYMKPKKNSLFIELGSGDGRLLRRAAQTYSIKGVGYDINWILIAWSRFLSKRDKTSSQVTFIKSDIFTVDLRKADYVYFFLMPKIIDSLIPKFEKELRKNVLVATHGFKIPGWEKKLVHTLPDKDFSTFYYKI